jgi:aminoglycoside phosphotransferase (APT) family kinase protein
LDALSADKLLKRYLGRPETKEILQAQSAEICVLIPSAGRNSITRLIEVDGAPRGVLRIFPRSEAPIVRRRQLLEELIAGNDLPMPALLDVYDKEKDKTIVVLEEFVDGTHPNPGSVDSDQAAALADALAAIHRVSSPGHGFPGAVKTRGFHRDALRAVRHRFTSIDRFDSPRFDRSERKRVKRWFGDFSQRLKEIREFSLIHYKPQARNLIWRPAQKRFILIDLTTMRFGCPLKDLAQVRHQIFGADPGPFDILLKRYREKAGNAFLQTFDAVETFFHAYFHLGQCAINCHSHLRGEQGENPSHPDPLKDGLLAWNDLLEIVETGGNRPG